MAIEDDARDNLLEAIAEKAKQGPNSGQLRNLAEAYALVVRPDTKGTTVNAGT